MNLEKQEESQDNQSQEEKPAEEVETEREGVEKEDYTAGKKDIIAEILKPLAKGEGKVPSITELKELMK